MWFSTCCRYSLSKSNGYCFPCIVTSHLISSGWISICCSCCFTRQWICFSHVVTALFRAEMDVFFFVCSHITFSKQWMNFHMLSLLFHLAVDVVSTCCHSSLRKQWCWFSMCFQCTLNKQWMIFHLTTKVN